MSRIEHEPVPCKVCGLVGKHSFELPPTKLRRTLFSPSVEAWCDFATGKLVGRVLVLRYSEYKDSLPKISGRVYEYSSLELSKVISGTVGYTEISYGKDPS